MRDSFKGNEIQFKRYDGMKRNEKFDRCSLLRR